jgi:hypothetical protein
MITELLQVHELQETDAGTYQCEIIVSTLNIISAGVKLSIRRPPVISDDSTRNVVSTVGEDVSLECYATGYPQPRVSWRRQSNAMLRTGRGVFQ